MKIVFDTYAWTEYFKGTKKGNIVKNYLKENDVLTPIVVLLELSYISDRESWDFKKHLNFIKINSEIISINEEFILSFGVIYNKFKEEIKDISFADVIILNIALKKNARILTGDKHFENIENVIML